MRPTTSACARFESKGRPDDTLTLIDQPVGDILRELAMWTLKTQMGHHIQITLARSESDLMRIARSAGSSGTQKELSDQVMADIMAALESGTGEED